MIIKKLNDVPSGYLPGNAHVKKQIVLGPDDGSQEIVLRYFSIAPEGKSPHHSHDFPHLVKIESGKGIAKDSAGTERQLQAGDYIYVESNEVHQFVNTGSEPFDFVCIVPIRGES